MRSFQTKNPIEREILNFMKEHPLVTSQDIARACSAGEVARLRAFRKLRRNGVIRYAGKKKHKWLWTTQTADDLQVRAAGKRLGGDAAIWTAMRALSVFSPEDIQASLIGSGREIPPEEIQSYCSALVRAKYLAVLVTARPGHRAARYRLARNTGPLPPKRKRMTVLVDLNEDRIVYAGGERL